MDLELAPGIQEIENLKSGGFDDSEITSWQNDTTSKLMAGGFSEDEVNKYFGRPKVDTSAIKNFVDTNIKAHMGQKEPKEASNFFEALQAGLQTSASGLIVRGEKPDTILSDPEHASRALRIANQIGQLAGDIPAMVSGGILGGAIGSPTVVGAPVGAAMGAFAVPNAIRKMLMDHYERGDITTKEEFVDRLLSTSWETIKGATVGAATGLTGGAVGAVAGPMATMAAELAAMTTTGAALERHLPSFDDFIDGAIVLGGLHGAGKISTKLRNIYAQTGEHPATILDAAEKDVILKQQLLDEDPNTPAQAQPTELKHELVNVAKEGEEPKHETKTEIVPKTQVSDGKPPSEPPSGGEGGERTEAEKEILSKIGVSAEPTKKTIKEKFDDFYAKNIDYLDPLKSAIQDARQNGLEVPSKENAYEKGRLFAANMDRTRSFLEFGTRDAKTGEINGEGLNQILKSIPGNDIQGYKAYAMAKRGLELHARDIVPWKEFNPETAKVVIEAGKNKFEEVDKRRLAFKDRILQYAKDKGLYDDEALERIKAANRNHIPFNRIQEADVWTGKVKGSANVLKRIFGDQKDILNPILQDYKNTEMIIRRADINDVRTSFVKSMKDSGLLAEGIEGETTEDKYLTKIPSKMIPKVIGSDELSNALKKQGIEVKPDDITVFRPETSYLKDNQIAVFEDGKRVVYEGSPGVIDALKRMDGDKTSLDVFSKTMGVFAKATRIGTVANPFFAFRHFFRSQIMSSVYSKTGLIPFWHSAFAIKDIVGKTPEYQEWLYQGGASSSWFKLDETYLKNGDIEAADKKAPFIGKAWNAVHSIKDAAEGFIKLTDNAARLAEYKRSVEKGITPEEAAFRSRNVVPDYQRVGLQRSALRTGVAFIGAHINSLDRMAEELKTDPKGMVAKLSVLSAISAMVYVANKDDPAIEALPDWQKDTYWNFNISRMTGQGNPKGVGDYILRLPKPWAPGIMFGSGLEVALDAYFKDNPNRFQHFAENITKSILPEPMPNLVAPILDQYSNKQGFTGQPLISKNKENMVPELQYEAYTSETAKQIAKLIGYVPLLKDIGTENATLSSPPVVENYIRAWTGTVGGWALKISDAALRAAGIGSQVEGPEATWADNVFTREFLSRYPSLKAQDIQDFYENKNKTDKVMNSISYSAKNQMSDEMTSLIERFPDLQINLDGVGQAISTSNHVMRNILADPNTKPVEKRQLMDTLLLQTLEMAKLGNSQMREFQKAQSEQKKEGK